MTCPPATAVRKIKLTQGKVALVDEVDYDYLMQWSWCADAHRGKFRVRGNIKIDGKFKGMRMHTLVARRAGIDTKLIDHIDRNPLNNCRYNLREANHSQNAQNRGATKCSTTGVKGVKGVKGVYKYKPTGKYGAQIEHCHKKHFLGYFDTIDEAEKVVIAKRKELAGEFACNDRRTV